MLFKARIEFDIVVKADDEYDAKDVLDECVADELDNLMLSQQRRPELEPVHNVDELPAEWEDAIPFVARYEDSSDPKTCAEILGSES